MGINCNVRDCEFNNKGVCNLKESKIALDSDGVCVLKFIVEITTIK